MKGPGSTTKPRIAEASFQLPIGYTPKEIFPFEYTGVTNALEKSISNTQGDSRSIQTAFLHIKEERELIEEMLFDTGHYKLVKKEGGVETVTFGYPDFDKADFPTVTLPPGDFDGLYYKASVLIRARMGDDKRQGLRSAPARIWIKPSAITTFEPGRRDYNDYRIKS